MHMLMNQGGYSRMLTNLRECKSETSRWIQIKPGQPLEIISWDSTMKVLVRHVSVTLLCQQYKNSARAHT